MASYVQYIITDVDNNMFMYFVDSENKANEHIKQLDDFNDTQNIDKFAGILRESTVDEIVIGARDDYFCSCALNKKVERIVSHFVVCWPGIYHESDDESVASI